MRYILPLLLCAILCFGISHPSLAQPTDKLNVLLIISDDQHFGDYGFMGHPVIDTPRIDRLASESLVFRRGYVSTSLCCPSLASMITGQYPRTNGVTGNLINPLREQQAVYVDLMLKAPTIPRILGEHGYLSLQTGKWWHGNWANGGFTHGMSHGDVARGGRHGDEGLVIGREGMDPIPGFIDQAKAEDKPFFIWYAPFLPHTPHTPPQRLFDKYKARVDSPHIARYWAMCEWFDESCGELLDLLEQKGVADNTIVLYICDNGWINQPDRQRYAPRSKRSPYDGGLRTPIMIKWPGHVEPGEAEGIAANIDLLPTILDACGIDIPDNIDGISLLKIQDRSSFTGGVYSHDAVDILDPAANLLYRWRLDGPWKLIEPNAARLPDEQPQLFNILEDPAEQNDLAQEHPDIVAKLKQQINASW
ncbi:MAG: sulfatase [Planctomycetota bacterium]